MKLTVVSNGTKEGTFVRNADTGEALEGVEHIAFNFDGEKCVTTVMLTTGLVVSDRIVALPLTDEESRAVQDSFMNPDGLTSKPMTGFRTGEGCRMCGLSTPHAHHSTEGGVNKSTKHIPASPLQSTIDVCAASVEVAKEILGVSVLTVSDNVHCYACGISSSDLRASQGCEAGGYLEHKWTAAVQWKEQPIGVEQTDMLGPSAHEPLAHCLYCKMYYCDATSDWKNNVSCTESSDHRHQWMPPWTKEEEPRGPKPPVLPTRIGYVAGKPEYVGKFETRKEIPISEDPYLELVGQYPHCDAYVLHARGTCEFCDLPSNTPLHEWRKANNVNYTGESDPNKATCPAEARRSKATIDKWYGNTAKPKEKT